MNFSSYDNEIDEDITNSIEKLKDQFIRVDVQNIYIYFLYVVNQTCENYKRIVLPINDGVLTKDILMSEIIKNRNDSGRRFNVTGIYNYNFDKDDLVEFMNNGHVLNEFTNVVDIPFNKSIDYFEHHNAAFIFLSNEKSKNTKKTNTIPRKKTLKHMTPV
jgi:hypothetical protein